jgi:hypothetical protein
MKNQLIVQTLLKKKDKNDNLSIFSKIENIDIISVDPSKIKPKRKIKENDVFKNIQKVSEEENFLETVKKDYIIPFLSLLPKNIRLSKIDFLFFMAEENVRGEVEFKQLKLLTKKSFRPEATLSAGENTSKHYLQNGHLQLILGLKNVEKEKIIDIPYPFIPDDKYLSSSPTSTEEVKRLTYPGFGLAQNVTKFLFTPFKNELFLFTPVYLKDKQFLAAKSVFCEAFVTRNKEAKILHINLMENARRNTSSNVEEVNEGENES